jgi:hypothetical protein
VPGCIETAEEFVRLRSSEDAAEQQRAAHSAAPEAVWHDVIARFPAYRFWVAQNKTVPLSILRDLAGDTDARVRSMIARKRKLDRALFDSLALDAEASVRAALTHNPKCPEDLRVRLIAGLADLG